MDYSIDENALFALVDEEVSKVADESFSEDGVSLYDLVVLTEKDGTTVQRLIGDGVSRVVRAMNDIVTYTPASGQTLPKLVFNAPDMDTSLTALTTASLTRSIVLTACALLFRQRRPALVEEYNGRAQEALDNAETNIRKRTAPTRS